MNYIKGPYRAEGTWIGTRGGETVGYVSGHRNRRPWSREELEATARLFAGSPELFDIAEKYIALCTHCGLFQEAEDAKLLVARVRVGE